MQGLVVSTEHRGVFFGYGEPTDSDTIRLEKARMCIYWAPEVRGFTGLASVGPIGGSKVGPAAPSMTLRGVTAVMECSPEAIQRWEVEPWTK